MPPGETTKPGKWEVIPGKGELCGLEMALMRKIQTAVLSGSAGQCGSKKSHDTL